MSDFVVSQVEEVERKRIEELVRERIKPLYVVRESISPFRESHICDQICTDLATFLFFYKRGEISDEEFDKCLLKLEEDYLQFVLEREKAHMQDVKKIAYELKKNL
jgi:hypothetical protein